MYNRELARLVRAYVEVLVADAGYQDASRSNMRDRAARMSRLGDELEAIHVDLPDRVEKFANTIIERIEAVYDAALRP